MGAYAAIVSLKFSLNRLLNHFDVCLDPPSLEIAEFLNKEAKSFQKFLRRLDSNSRKRMKLLSIKSQWLYVDLMMHLHCILKNKLLHNLKKAMI